MEKPRARRMGLAEIAMGLFGIGVADGLLWLVVRGFQAMFQAGPWPARLALWAGVCFLLVCLWAWVGQVGIAIMNWSAARKRLREK